MKNKNLMRSKVCGQFLKDNQVNCCSIIENDDEGSFTQGCDCCKSLPQNTYECNGYNPKSKSVVLLGDVCGDCIAYFYNGTDEVMGVRS